MGAQLVDEKTDLLLSFTEESTMDPQFTLHLFHGTVFLASFTFFFGMIFRRLRLTTAGRPFHTPADRVTRLRAFLLNVLFQEKLFKHPVRGVMHATIFYGFFVYVFHSLGQMVAGNTWSLLRGRGIDPYRFSLIPGEGLELPIPPTPLFIALLALIALTFYLYRAKHQGKLFEAGRNEAAQNRVVLLLSAETVLLFTVLLGSGRHFFESVLNAFSLLILFALLFFGYIRWIKRIRGLDVPSNQSMIVLSMIALLMLSTLVYSASFAALSGDPTFSDRPIGALLELLGMETYQESETWMHLGWWVHILTVYSFMIYIPLSKHAHLIFAPINYSLIGNAPRGAMRHIDLEDEQSVWGAQNVSDLSSKTLLDSLSCIECGRCTLECPANRTGKPLDPKKIIVDIKHAALQYEKELLAQTTERAPSPVVGAPYIEEEELWSCTSCRACVEACPVGNNQLDPILEMRRDLVLDKSVFPPQLQQTFNNIEKNSNPWGIGAESRVEWCGDLNVKTLAEESEVELLYWVGCAGSFDERNKKIARSLVKILQHADVRFGILGNEENCTGDSARRGGNEYLFQTLAQTNIETMNRYGVKKIVTACPHCFNTLKNEYPGMGGTYEVIHHTDYIAGLISSGKLKLGKKLEQKGVFHDSCYLGRYNDVYSAPRTILSGTVATTEEAIEHGSSSLCCGAGGAQMWMEEKYDRVNLLRTKQLLETKPDLIATACPFCNIMLSDGVKAHEKQDSTRVMDVAEVVAELLEENG